MESKNDLNEAEAFQRLVQEVVFSDNDWDGNICAAAMLDQQLKSVVKQCLIPSNSKAEA